jgi:hypothetical protein
MDRSVSQCGWQSKDQLRAVSSTKAHPRIAQQKAPHAKAEKGH